MGPETIVLGGHTVVVPVSGLDGLAASVVARTASVGEPPEDRPFVGHLTLARLRSPVPPESVGVPLAAEFPVGEACLVASHLLPDGAAYEVLERFPLIGCPRRSGWGLLFENDAGRVDAVAVTGGRRTIREHVTEVGTARPAGGLGPTHSMAGVGPGVNPSTLSRSRETRPTAPRVKLGSAIEHHSVACLAPIGSGPLLVAVGAGEGPFGSGFLSAVPGHRVQTITKVRVPFSVGDPLLFRGEVVVHNLRR